MHKKIYVQLIVLFFAANVSAQPTRCGANEYKIQEEQKNPLLKTKRESNEQNIRSIISGNSQFRLSQVTVIPVVVHLLYNNGEQNIPDAKIIEQIDVLNNDYARTNQDAVSTPTVFQSVSANTGIQFCLAKRDPNGKPTTGIERKYTTQPFFSIGDDMKHAATGGLDGWPYEDYLNLWICNFEGSLLGFATFPGNATVNDGVVVFYESVGGPDAIGTSNAYNLGRTVTHEVGHWLGLYHVWGDDGGACTGTDNVDDTPNQAKEHYGTPAFPYVSCDNGPNGDMFMNYLDYSDDFSMNMFTDGQAAQMNATLLTDRNSILTSLGCIAPNALPIDAAITVESPTGVLCTNAFSATIILKNVGTQNITSAKIKYSVDDSTAQTYNWSGILTAGNADIITLTSLTAVEGVHNFIVKDTLVNGSSTVDANTSNNISVKEFTTAAFTLGLPIKEDFETKSFPQHGWNITNNDNGTTWMRTALAANGGKASLWINGSANTIEGTVDDISLEPFDISAVSEPILAFDVAYQSNSALSGTHTLQILASVDCGETFSVVYEKSNDILKTAIGSQNPFVPSSASQWRKDTLSLKSFAGATSLFLVFRNIAGNSNGLFIDNINIGSVRDIFPDAENINFTVLPNPSKGMLNFTLRLLQSTSATLRIFNSIGQKAFEKEYNVSSANEQIDLRKFRSGVYSVQVISEGEKKSSKIVIY